MSRAAQQFGRPWCWLPLGLLLGAGCLGTDLSQTVNGDVLGPRGGFAISADGRAILLVPPGALTREVNLALEPSLAPVGALPDTAYRITPPHLQFEQAAELTLRPEQAGDDVDPLGLALVQAPEDGTGLRRLLTSVGERPPSWVAAITHTGLFALAPECSPIAECELPERCRQGRCVRDDPGEPDGGLPEADGGEPADVGSDSGVELDGGAEPGPCQVDEECPPSWGCLAGQCTPYIRISGPPCWSNEDCYYGFCSGWNGVCLPRNFDWNCPAGLALVSDASWCLPECSAVDRCPEGQVCQLVRPDLEGQACFPPELVQCRSRMAEGVGVGVEQICDGQDDDCDGRTDEGLLEFDAQPLIPVGVQPHLWYAGPVGLHALPALVVSSSAGLQLLRLRDDPTVSRVESRGGGEFRAVAVGRFTEGSREVVRLTRGSAHLERYTDPGWEPCWPLPEPLAEAPVLTSFVGELDQELAAHDQLDDLVLFEPNSSTLWLFFGHPRGVEPAEVVMLPVDEAVRSLALADLDQDGVNDLITADGEQGLILVRPGLGGAAFGPPQPWSVAEPVAKRQEGPPYTELAVGSDTPLPVADLDGDRLPDLVLPVRIWEAGPGAGWSNGLVTLLGRGDGTFAIREPQQAPAYTDLRLGDLDADLIPDLVGGSGQRSSCGMHLQLGLGDGTFAESQLIPTPTCPWEFCVADLDGQGELDVAFTLPSWPDGGHTSPPVPDETGVGFLQVLQGRGDGTLQPASAFHETPGVPLTIGDLDGDRFTDVVTFRHTQAAQQVLIGFHDHLQGFVTREAATFELGARIDRGEVVDFTGDGLPDLVVGSRDLPGWELYLLANQGNRAWVERGTLSTVASTLVWGRLDRDRTADLLTLTTGPATLQTQLSRGDGSFTAAWSQAFVEGASSPVLADFDRDGHTDLGVLVHQTGPLAATLLAVFLGQGDGTFAVPLLQSPIIMENVSASMTAGDVDGDRFPDLVVTREGPAGSSRFYLNRGDGTFGEGQPITGTGPALVVDLDNNSYPDLVVPDTTRNVLLVHYDPWGHPRAARSQAYDLGSQWSFLGVGDFNNDGLPDLASTGDDLDQHRSGIRILTSRCPAGP